MSLFQKSEEEKRISRNRRILVERPHLWTISPEWKLDNLELSIHSPSSDSAARYNLETILSWRVHAFPYSRLWIYFSGDNSALMYEIHPATESENRYYWEIIEALWYEKKSGKYSMLPKSIILVHIPGRVTNSEIDEYRLSNNDELLQAIIRNAQKRNPTR